MKVKLVDWNKNIHPCNQNRQSKRKKNIHVQYICTKWQILLPFYIPQVVESLPSYIPEAWKWYPFQVESPQMGHYKEYPPPLPGHRYTCIKGQFKKGTTVGQTEKLLEFQFYL